MSMVTVCDACNKRISDSEVHKNRKACVSVDITQYDATPTYTLHKHYCTPCWHEIKKTITRLGGNDEDH